MKPWGRRNPAAFARGDAGVTLPSAVALGVHHQWTFDIQSLGDRPLIFDEPGAEPARIQVAGTPRTRQFSVPIAIAGGESLAVEVISSATLSLRRGLAGDNLLTKTGAGALELFAGNPAWSGQLLVNGGEVSLGNAASLGAGTGVAANGTRVNAGGVLRFNALMDPAQELIQLDGGAIVDRSFGVRGNTLGPIELLSTSAMRNSLGSSFEPTVLAGPISGPGGLNLQGDFTFSGDNTYAGETIIEASGNIRVSVNSPTGLGGVRRVRPSRPTASSISTPRAPSPCFSRAAEFAGTITRKGGPDQSSARRDRWCWPQHRRSTLGKERLKHSTIHHGGHKFISHTLAGGHSVILNPSAEAARSAMLAKPSSSK